MTAALTASFVLPPDRPAQALFATEALPYFARLSRASLICVVLAHVGVLTMLLVVNRASDPITPPRPIIVSLIEPEIEQPKPQIKPEPRPTPPKPVTKLLPPPPVLIAEPLPTLQPVVEAPQPEPLPEVLPEVPPPVVIVAEAPKPAPTPPPPPTPPRPADYLNNPKPAYPPLSRRLHEEGVVRLNILVNPDGSVARLEIAKSSGYARLDKSALDTVPSWKFVPAHQGGQPIADWVIVPIQFTLRS